MILLGQIVSGVLAILLLILKERQADTYGKTQDNRKDIIDGNVAAIEQRIDKLCQGQSISSAGIPSAEDVERRLRQL